MSVHNSPLQEFLQSVCQEIRYKSVHRGVIRELTDHIEDQKYEYIARGLDEVTAVQKAIEEMGDPALVGKQLDNAHRPRTDWPVLVLVSGLVLCSGFLQYYLSGISENTAYMFTRFLTYSPLGMVAFLLMYFFDYTLIGRYSKPAFILLLLGNLLGFAVLSQRNGTYAHVYYTSLIFIPLFAGVVYSFRKKGYRGLLYSCLYLLPAAAICLFAPSMRTLVILIITCLIIMIDAIIKGYYGCNKKIALITLSLILLMLLVLMLMSLRAYQIDRIVMIFHPELDPHGAGYHTLVVRSVVGKAQPFGSVVLDGVFNGMSIERVLPEWRSDFALAYMIAKLGYVPGIALILTLAALIARMFRSAWYQKNTYGHLVSLAACLTITVQIVLYILTNLGIIMPLSMVLPFISFGAYGFIINMALLGLLLSVYRRSDLVHDRLQSVKPS